MPLPQSFVFRFASSKSCLNMDQRLSKIFLVIGVIVTYASGDITKRDVDNIGRRCQMGDTWMENCNKCYCGIKGVPICTRWLCVGPPENTITHFNDEFCTPFSRWKDDCNICFCTAEGMPKCTDYDCGPKKNSRVQRDFHPWSSLPQSWYANDQDGSETQKVNYRHRRSAQGYTDSQGYCQPGFSWYDGCNRHSCTNEGIPMSTLRYCPPHDTYHNVGRCNPGATWMINYRSCYCTARAEAICTSNPRYPREVSSYNRPKIVERDMYKKACQPGYIWDDGCNSFACTDDGYFASSLNVCPEETINHDVRMCADGSTWNFGSWKCRCNDKGYGKCIQTGTKKRTHMHKQHTTQDVR